MLRTSQYVNWLRSYSVYVDGKRVGRVRNGKTFECDVTPGHHEVWVKIDWAESLRLSREVQSGEQAIFFCGCHASAWSAVSSSLAGPGAYLFLIPAEDAMDIIEEAMDGMKEGS